jgi:ubiquinone biosynthesis protein COQ4
LYAFEANRSGVQEDFMGRCHNASAGTFGGAYSDFMNRRGFHADERPPVRFVDDAEIAYVATRYRQVHDFWHVLFDCHTSLLGETALKALEFVQVLAPPFAPVLLELLPDATATARRMPREKN